MAKQPNQDRVVNYTTIATPKKPAASPAAGAPGATTGGYTGLGGSTSTWGTPNKVTDFSDWGAGAPMGNMTKAGGVIQVGGHEQGYKERQKLYTSGIAAGDQLTGIGAGYANQGVQQLGQAGAAGMGMYGQGMGIGASGMGGQDRLLGASMLTAGRDVGSAARLQQQMANDAIGQRMQAQAASARGGNAAAAMRGAQAQASANQMQTNQQLALMRQQEAVDNRNALMQAQQFGASQYGDRAAMGYGTAAAGLGAANTAGSGIGGIGGDVMGAGVGKEGNYLNSLGQFDTTQADLAKHAQEQNEKRNDRLWGLVGGSLSSIGGIASLAGR